GRRGWRFLDAWGLCRPVLEDAWLFLGVRAAGGEQRCHSDDADQPLDRSHPAILGSTVMLCSEEYCDAMTAPPPSLAAVGACCDRRKDMTVYIDPPIWPGHGRLWSHMISDQSYEELHGFAAQIGIPRRGFERDHYDVVADRYAVALAAGAQPVASRGSVTMW